MTARATPTAYLLLPVHNRREVTRGFVQCFLNQRFRDAILVLVDDGSNDGTADMVRSLVPQASILKGDGHFWWAGSLQWGLDWLASNGAKDEDVVLFINDDSRFAPDFIAKGVAALGRAPGALLQASIRCVDSGAVVDRGYVFEPQSLSFRPVHAGEAPNCLTTNGLFARFGDLTRIGGFHSRLLPHYLSDYEYTLRAGRRGFVLRVDPDLELTWQTKSTGYRSIEARSVSEFLGKLFSPRYPSNPLHTTAFAFLACPLPLALIHTLRIWRAAADTWMVWLRERRKSRSD